MKALTLTLTLAIALATPCHARGRRPSRNRASSRTRASARTRQSSLANAAYAKLKAAALALPATKRPDANTLRKIERYLQKVATSTKELDQAVNLLIEPQADKTNKRQARQIAALQIDGRPGDWLATDFLHKDGRNDTRPIDAKKPASPAAPQDDLHRWAFAQDQTHLYFLFQPQAAPKPKEQFHYRINLINAAGRIVYAVVWVQSGDLIQQWNTEDGSYQRNVPITTCQFARDRAFEAKVPKALLPALPRCYKVQPVVWHSFKNRLDAHSATPHEPRQKHNFALFIEYAQKGYLAKAPPHLGYLAQALQDGHIYGQAQTRGQRALQERIVRDGHLFQRALPPHGHLDLACQLILAARHGIFGGYNDLGYPYPLTPQSYEFMYLQPQTLAQCQKLLRRHKLDRQSLEPFLAKVLKYRRYSQGDIDELARHNNNKKWREIARQSRNEDPYITTINGRQVHKGVNWSATFQVAYLLRHGHFYGNCVDVTAVAQACYKTLGLPALHICFGPITQGHYREQHSFPVYFDQNWYSYNRKGNEIATWMEKPGRRHDVYFYINGPQLNSQARSFKITERNNKIGTNNRAHRFVVSKKRWRQIQRQGLTHNFLLKCLFAPR